MTKTHLIVRSDANLLLNQELTAKPFDFDLLMQVQTGFTGKESRSRLLSTLAFAASADVKVALDAVLRDYQQTRESVAAEDGEVLPWQTYQEFLDYAAGLAASQQTMTEAGMNVNDLRKTVQSLYTFRTACYDVLGTAMMPTRWTPQDIHDFLRNPKLRGIDVNVAAKAKMVTRERAKTDEGVIDIELEKMLLEGWERNNLVRRQNQLEWDKRRGEVASLMFTALDIRDDCHVDASMSVEDLSTASAHHDDTTTHVGEGVADPFLDLSSEYQFRLLSRTVQRYVPSMLNQLVEDIKVPYEETATATIESRGFIKACKAALDHPRMKRAELQQIERGLL